MEYESILTFVSNDPDEEELEIQVRVYIPGNMPPEIVREIPDFEIDEDAEPFFAVDLDEIFSDPDDDRLGFNAFSDDGHIDLEIDVISEVCWTRPNDESSWLVGFSFNPPIGNTFPRRVISPVIATSRFTGRLVSADARADAIVIPADGPSFGTAPAGTWI